MHATTGGMDSLQIVTCNHSLYLDDCIHIFAYNTSSSDMIDKLWIFVKNLTKRIWRICGAPEPRVTPNLRCQHKKVNFYGVHERIQI